MLTTAGRQMGRSTHDEPEALLESVGKNRPTKRSARRCHHQYGDCGENGHRRS
ncbi:MAG: hypothetical protein ACRDNK_10200 [Solirubrobacteraceae bacterium]